ncbi:glutaredoxin domain-containing protein [Apiospora phragmitis]|uniref:Glutaredoxin-like protein n=1 Tax=Apiospora phragmitis TaxID=2905665 RepID=A0ABR1TPR2_9PEZI
MRATTRLFQHATRITLFTRENCGLCVQAKSVLSSVKASRPFDYEEVDIIKDESIPRWRDLYEFDVPVIHVSKATAPKEDPKSASKALKLMHRLTAEEVQAKMDAAEGA